MSRSVSTTRTTVVTSGTSDSFNAGYLGTLPGLLKISQLILGAICLGITAYYFNPRFNWGIVDQRPELFFLLVATTFFIGTFCLLTASFVSLSAATMISKTIYDIIYHGIAFIFYFCASLTLLIRINTKYDLRSYSSSYKPYTADGILGLILAVLYLVSTYFAYRHYRGN